jgi:uncharacterized protein involved in exopolysaccharide biosynthesis
MDQERAVLSSAEAGMQDVQEQTGLFVAPSQAEVLVRSTAELQAEIAASEVALESLRSGATLQNPEVQRRETELASLRGHLRSIQGSASPASRKVTTGAQFPAAEVQHIRRLRELRYHETMFELLAKQFEAARIDEAKEAPVIQIVDSATTPDKPGGISLTIAAVGGAVLCGLFTGLYVFIAAAVANPEKARKAAHLRRLLWRISAQESLG